MSIMPDLRGRAALVTGGSRGIGKAVAVCLAEAGADVAVNFSTRRPDAETVADEIRRRGRRAVVLGADVSRASEVQRLVQETTGRLGPVDILVNNAGISERRSIDELSEDDFDRTIAVNLKSAWLCIDAVFRGMRERRWGRIVNITSGAARGAGVVGPHYNASKAGMEGLTRGYASRLVKDGITVNAVAPSLIATEMIAPHRQESVAKVPLGRLGDVEEVAQAVVMVVCNPYMTGQTIQLNGGMHFI